MEFPDGSVVESSGLNHGSEAGEAGSPPVGVVVAVFGGGIELHDALGAGIALAEATAVRAEVVADGGFDEDAFLADR